MRAPRYRFPDEVRSTTRAIAAQMVAEGDVARTPEELNGWISTKPDILQALEQGGYGAAFDAGDLFPLLQVFVVQLVGPPPQETGSLPSKRLWVVAAVVVLAVVFLWLVLA